MSHHRHSDRDRIEKLEKDIRALERLIEMLLLRLSQRSATKILIIGENMADLQVTAGGSPLSVQLVPLPPGSIFALPANLALTADDADVVISADPTDPTGATFNVSIPAGSLATSFNLDATGLAPNADPTQPPVPVTGTVAVTVLPAVVPPPPVIPATSIGIIATPPAAPTQQTSAPAQPATATSPAVNAKAPASS